MSQIVTQETLYDVLQVYEDRLRRLEHAALYDFPIGAIVSYAGFISPGANANDTLYRIPPFGFLHANGDAVSRSEYEPLFNRITIPSKGDWANNSVIIANIPTTFGMLPGFPVSGPGIPAGTTVNTVTNDNVIVISQLTTAGATQGTFVVAPFGVGNGTTTFNLPNVTPGVNIIRAR